MRSSKILTVEKLAGTIERLRRQNKRVVFTNGCFDLIHTGHTRYLHEARQAGDYLVVAVNSDRSVSCLKGPKRPIIPLQERMEILAGLYFVDYVVSFDELDPYGVIKVLKPSVLIKGGDWPIDKIIGKDLVEADGGEVFTVPEIPGRSTTDIIDRILELHNSSDD
ncbi:MAG: D-glycero-beta-D-manno-heptose 1-phosphate adenylyltransferase [Proteobacteria bacterium]|nr:D-glycero-beta-D-manno-heptose 1-phosphate adenylyltransferase [Pseudomonadota bacterium]